MAEALAERKEYAFSGCAMAERSLGALVLTAMVALIATGCASAQGAPAGWNSHARAQVIAVNVCLATYPTGECEEYAVDYAQCPHDGLYLYLPPQQQKACVIWRKTYDNSEPQPPSPPQVLEPTDPAYP